MNAPALDCLVDLPFTQFKRARAAYWLARDTHVSKTITTKRQVRLIHSRDRSYGLLGYRPRLLKGLPGKHGTPVLLCFQDNTAAVGLLPPSQTPLTLDQDTITLSPLVFGLSGATVTRDLTTKRSDLCINTPLKITSTGEGVPTDAQAMWHAALMDDLETIANHIATHSLCQPAWAPMTPTVNETAILQAWLQTTGLDNGILSFESFLPNQPYARVGKLTFQQNGMTQTRSTKTAHRFSRHLWTTPPIGQTWATTKSGYILKGAKITLQIQPLSAHQKIALLAKAL